MEIINTRRFHHPREKVFDAFAEPEQLAHGWGPDGFTNTIERFELRSGGAWHVTMHALGGAAYPNESEFVEVVRPARIVMVHVRPLHRFEMTMTYSEVEDGTELTWAHEARPASGECEVARIHSRGERPEPRSSGGPPRQPDGQRLITLNVKGAPSPR